MSSEKGISQAHIIALVALFIALFSSFNSCDARDEALKAVATPEPLATRASERVNVVDAQGTPVWTCDEAEMTRGYFLVGCVPFAVPSATATEVAK